jgi:hypothetical protein
LHPQWCKHLGLPTGLLTGAGRDAMLAAMAASLAATACCTSGLRRMMSSRAGPLSSASVWCNLGHIVDRCLPLRAMGFHRGDPEITALKSLSIARSEKTLFIFGLTSRGLNNYLITRKTTKRSTVYTILANPTNVCGLIHQVGQNHVYTPYIRDVSYGVFV